MNAFNETCMQLNASIQAYKQTQVSRTNVFGRPRREAQVARDAQRAKSDAIKEYEKILKDTIGKGEAFKICEYKNLAQVDSAINEMIAATETLKTKITSYVGGGKKIMKGGGVEEKGLIQELNKAISSFKSQLGYISKVSTAINGMSNTTGLSIFDVELFIMESQNILVRSLVQKTFVNTTFPRAINILKLINLAIPVPTHVQPVATAGVAQSFDHNLPPVLQTTSQVQTLAGPKMEDIDIDDLLSSLGDDSDFGAVVPNLDLLAGQSSTGAFAGDDYPVVPDIDNPHNAFAGHAEQRQPVMHSAFGASAVGHTGAFAGDAEQRQPDMHGKHGAFAGHAEQRQPVMHDKYGAFGASAVGHAGTKEEGDFNFTLNDLYGGFGGVKKKKTRRKKGRTTRKKRKSINKKRKSSRRKRKSSRRKRKSSRKKN